MCVSTAVFFRKYPNLELAVSSDLTDTLYLESCRHGLNRRSYFVMARFLFLLPLVALTCSAASSEDDVSTSMRDFTRLYSTVQQNFADPLNPDQAIYDGAIPGMLLTLDPHSHFFDPRALKAMREDQSGHYYGVGMEVVGRTNATIVVHPFVGSPAYKAGLLPNDVIANVGGRNTA